MSRIAYALSGRDTCTGQCETRLGCDCTPAQSCPPCNGNCNQGRTCPAPSLISTHRGWFDRWLHDMRIAYLRKLISNGEARQEELRQQIRDNANDLAQLRVELALLEA